MPTDVNLGRVQGMGWWFADATFTTSGTITLQAGFTIEPYVGDYVVDTTNGNVYAIATISGTNPFSFTTNGTVIYTIKSASDDEWDDEIIIGRIDKEQVVSEDIATKLQNFLNIIKDETKCVYAETYAKGFTSGGSRYGYCLYTTNLGSIEDTNSFNNINTIAWRGMAEGTYNDVTIRYNTENKTFTLTPNYTTSDATYYLYSLCLRYKVINVPVSQNILYNMSDLNALAIQDTDNEYQFNNEEFKTNLIKTPHLVFLTINDHEFRGFFIDNGVYKHVDNVYNYNEETKENELIKTYTCLIDINQNLITYKEEQAE